MEPQVTLSAVNQKVEGVNTRVKHLDERLDEATVALGAMEQQLTGTQNQLATIIELLQKGSAGTGGTSH